MFVHKSFRICVVFENMKHSSCYSHAKTKRVMSVYGASLSTHFVKRFQKSIGLQSIALFVVFDQMLSIDFINYSNYICSKHESLVFTTRFFVANENTFERKMAGIMKCCISCAKVKHLEISSFLFLY